MTECHKEQGFTLIELIVVIVILGILAVTAAPKFMNLTSDANSAVVKGLAGAIRSASQTIYAKSKVNRNGANPSYVCATDECIGEEYLSAEEQQKKTQDLYNAAEARNGWIGVTDKGYPISGYSGGNNSIKTTIVGAIDLGVAMKGEDYINMMADEKNGYKGETSANKTDWIVYRVDSTGGTVLGGLVFVPKALRLTQRKQAITERTKKTRQSLASRPAASTTDRAQFMSWVKTCQEDSPKQPRSSKYSPRAADQAAMLSKKMNRS